MASRQIMSVVRSSFSFLSIQTSAAVNRLRELMLKRADPNTIGIKIGLARKGCENLSYTMNYTDKTEKFDEIVQLDKDIKVIIDSKAVMYLVGTEMDYTSTDILSEFTFKNPNQKSSCGCGKSFSV